MTRITVDPSTGGAVIETGNRLGDVALGLNNARRGLGHGSCPEVGLGGQAGNLSGLHICCVIILASNSQLMAASDTHPACGV